MSFHLHRINYYHDAYPYLLLKKLRQELQKLVLVHLKLPSSSLWFEPPTIVRWESTKQFWTTEGFFDIKFDEGKQTLSFRKNFVLGKTSSVDKILNKKFKK